MHLSERETGSPSANLTNPQAVEIAISNLPQDSKEVETDDVWATRVYDPRPYPGQEAIIAAWEADCDAWLAEQEAAQ